MDEAGRQHEAQRIGERVSRLRQFEPVRIAVEQAKDRHHQASHPQRRPHGQRHHDAQDQGRQGDHRFDQRQLDPDDAQKAAHRHDQGKGYRQHPQGRVAELRAPQAHGQHRHQMVRPEQWMRHAAHEATALKPENREPHQDDHECDLQQQADDAGEAAETAEQSVTQEHAEQAGPDQSAHEAAPAGEEAGTRRLGRGRASGCLADARARLRRGRALDRLRGLGCGRVGGGA